MKLVVGLGNPKHEYEGTRHNIGFAVIDYLENHSDFFGGAIFLKPDTFVNKSGEAVKKAKLKYKIKPENIVIIHDDLDIEFGKFKIAFARNAGGHNGVQSIIDHLKTNKFWRLRIGIANSRLKKMRHEDKVADFVLGKFTPSERGELPSIITTALHELRHRLDHA